MSNPINHIEANLGIPEAEFLANGALFCEPGGDLHLFWGEPTRADTASGSFPLLYVNDFNLQSAKPFLSFPNHKLIQRGLINLDSFNQSKVEITWNEPQQSDFEVIFEKIKGELTRGLEKTVPVMFSYAESKVSLSHLICSAIANRKERWLYGYWSVDGGFIGVTPELLFKRRGEFIRSMALAGTSKVEEVLLEPKNSREHQIVVDEIKRRLEGIGEVKVSPIHEVEIGAIKHLRAHLDCKLHRTIECNQLVELMHPTPALGSLPRPQLRTEQERYDSAQRGFFGSPFGFIEDRSAEIFVVSIRCIDWDRERIRLGAGCGVISESIFENEWQELKSKRESVREIFNL